MKNRIPHERLKVLRKTLGFTQQQFAERVGVSYSYILAVETGQRPMSKKLAMLISIATGVSSVWMIGTFGSPAKPLNEMREPYTREYFEKHFGLLKSRVKDEDRMQDDLNHGDEGALIEDLCENVARLLRASHKIGRFWACRYLLTEMLEEIEESLSKADAGRSAGRVGNFAGVLAAENTDGLPSGLFGTKNPWGDNSTTGPLEFMDAWRLVSPLGKFRWSDAMKGDKRKRDNLLSDFESLLEVVKASFTLPKQNPTPRRQPQKEK